MLQSENSDGMFDAILDKWDGDPHAQAEIVEWLAGVISGVIDLPSILIGAGYTLDICCEDCPEK